MELILKTKEDYHKNHLAMWGELVERMKRFRESGNIPEEFKDFDDLKLCVFKDLFGEKKVQHNCFGCAYSGANCCAGCLFDISAQLTHSKGCLNGIYYALCDEYKTSIETGCRLSLYAIELAEAIRDFPVKEDVK